MKPLYVLFCLSLFGFVVPSSFSQQVQQAAPNTLISFSYIYPITGLTENNCQTGISAFRYVLTPKNKNKILNLQITLNGKEFTTGLEMCDIPAPYPNINMRIFGTMPEYIRCGDSAMYQLEVLQLDYKSGVEKVIHSATFVAKALPCAHIEGSGLFCGDIQRKFSVQLPTIPSDATYTWTLGKESDSWVLGDNHTQGVSFSPEITVYFVGNAPAKNTLCVSSPSLSNTPCISLEKATAELPQPTLISIHPNGETCGYLLSVNTVQGTQFYDWGIGDKQKNFTTKEPFLGKNRIFYPGTIQTVFVRTRNNCSVSEWHSQVIQIPMEFPKDCR
jgi:hypothetical protein